MAPETSAKTTRQNPPYRHHRFECRWPFPSALRIAELQHPISVCCTRKGSCCAIIFPRSSLSSRYHCRLHTGHRWHLLASETDICSKGRPEGPQWQIQIEGQTMGVQLRYTWAVDFECSRLYHYRSAEECHWKAETRFYRPLQAATRQRRSTTFWFVQ